MRVCQFLPVMVLLGVLLSPASAQQTGYRTIHQFDNNPGGLVPNGLISANGALYGTTSSVGPTTVTIPMVRSSSCRRQPAQVERGRKPPCTPSTG
jgi:hypothetical protein